MKTRKTTTCRECKAYTLKRGKETILEVECICKSLEKKKGYYFWIPLNGDKVVRKHPHVRFVKKVPLLVNIKSFIRGEI